MEWHHTTSPRKKKFKAVPSAGKIMATNFWYREGIHAVASRWRKAKDLEGDYVEK
jgi:hypothetical protein